MFTLLLFLIYPIYVQGLCGSSIRWSHHFNMEDVYGMWYGVGYAQHTPDMTDKPIEIGCISLYINDATGEQHDDWLNWSIHRKNYTDQNWRSYKSNPWSDTPMSGSWLDIRLNRRSKRSVNNDRRSKRSVHERRKAKRGLYDERRIRVVWDEDGQTMEQNYVYSPDAPGLWTTEQWMPLEKEMLSRGIDVWYPDNPPRHPEVIRILKVTPEVLIINHCSEKGDGGVFSLILRRSPERIDRWQWYELQKHFYSFDLPTVHRYSSVCGGCAVISSIYVIVNIVIVILLRFL